MTSRNGTAPRVFVTDASYRHSLAILRSLARSGSNVSMGERETVIPWRRIGFWSRYCSRSYTYPDYLTDVSGAVAALREILSNERHDVLIPVSLNMVELAVQHSAELGVPMMIPGKAAFAIAANKKQTVALAASLDIPVPVTAAASGRIESKPPWILKHRRAGVMMAPSRAALDTMIAGFGSDREEYLVQEFIPGRNGYGYFGFFAEGRELGYFMHRRLMQYPIEGGPSVVAQSFFDPQLREYGRRILEALHWHGVAMVEFKKSDLDGRFYLMEINPKFWGSLDLAIHAGCNFPLWVQDYLLGRKLRIPGSYPLGVKFRWIIPSELKCVIQYPEYRGSFLRNCFDHNLSSELWLRDPLPGLAAMVSCFRAS